MKSRNSVLNKLFSGLLAFAFVVTAQTAVAGNTPEASKTKQPVYSPDANFKYDLLSNTPAVVSGTFTEVSAETTTRVFLSSTDVNRFVCSNGPVKDWVFSEEKGFTVSPQGGSLYLKYLVAKDSMTDAKTYANSPTELYVTCGDGAVYTLICVPRKVPAQTIQLSSKRGKLKKNVSLFEGMAPETKAAYMIKAAYKEVFPESFEVEAKNMPIGSFKNVNVLLRKTVNAEGEGLILKEYLLTPSAEAGGQIVISETDFLIPAITSKPLALSVSSFKLGKDSKVRLFVVEHKTESDQEL